MSRDIPVTASVATTSRTMTVTAGKASTGQALTSIASTSVTLSLGLSMPAIQYRVNSGAWKLLSGTEPVTLDVDMATDIVRVRRAENGRLPITLNISVDGKPRTLAARGISVGGGSGGALTVDEYLGAIGTRTCQPNVRHATNKQIMAHTRHFHRDAGDTLRICLPNFIVTTTSSTPTGTGQEAGGGGVMTYTAAYEAPDGTRYPFTFNGGAASGDAPDGSWVWTDDLTVPPFKPGDMYTLHYYGNTTGRIVYQSIATLSQGIDQASGDAMRVGVSGIADQTVSGTLVSNVTAGSGITLLPLAIVARTTRRSVYILADSRSAGANDTYDRAGDVGEVARSIGASMGYINLSVPSDRALWWLTYNAARIQFVDYVTDVVIVLGINDLISGGRTSAQVLADLATIVGLIKARKPSVRVYIGTITPHVTSSDSYASNNTAQSTNANRIAINDAIRAGSIAGMHKCIDLADANESYRNSGVLSLVGAANVVTDDGLHLKQFGLKRIEYSNIIRTAMGF